MTAYLLNSDRLASLTGDKPEPVCSGCYGRMFASAGTPSTIGRRLLGIGTLNVKQARGLSCSRCDKPLDGS